MEWDAFFAMGGYARYIWTAYGTTGLVLLVNFLKPRFQRKRLLQRLANTKANNE